MNFQEKWLIIQMKKTMSFMNIIILKKRMDF